MSEARDRLRDFDSLLAAYARAACGLTFAEVDEAERRLREARCPLAAHLPPSRMAEIEAAERCYLDHVRVCLRVSAAMVVFSGAILCLLVVACALATPRGSAAERGVEWAIFLAGVWLALSLWMRAKDRGMRFDGDA